MSPLLYANYSNTLSRTFIYCTICKTFMSELTKIGTHSSFKDEFNIRSRNIILMIKKNLKYGRNRIGELTWHVCVDRSVNLLIDFILTMILHPPRAFCFRN